MSDKLCYVPMHMRDGYKRWIENGIEPGDFGMAILRRDLKTAILLADIVNKDHISSQMTWLHNYAPPECWGSDEKVKNWKKSKKVS